MMTKAALLCASLAFGVVAATHAGEPPAQAKPHAKAPVLQHGQRRQTTLRVHSDGQGRVARVEVLRSAGSELDAFTSRYAREHWHGPPNSSKVVTFDCQLRK